MFTTPAYKSSFMFCITWFSVPVCKGVPLRLCLRLKEMCLCAFVMTLSECTVGTYAPAHAEMDIL